MSRAALAVALLLVTTGCVAPPVTDPDRNAAGPGDGADADGGIEVDGPPIGVDPDGVFERVQVVLDEDVDPPASIEVVDPDPENGTADADGSDGGNESGTGLSLRPEFWSAMGVERDPGGIENRGALENGLTTSLGRVVLFLGDNETTVVHYVLAHEFVHYVQFAEGHHRTVREGLDPSTTDGTYVFGSVLEGSAVFATDEYVRRYLDTDRTNSELYPRIIRQLEPGSLQRYFISRYVLGNRYVDGRIDDPADLPSVYEDPPRTTEQLIHGLDPGEEPPRDLSVAVDPGAYFRQGRDRMGEAWIRTALRNGVDRADAHRAAAGWGNDSLVTLRSGDGEAAYAWTLRFDDPANRSEFGAVFEDYLDARGDRTDGRWSVGEWAFDYRPVGDDTAVVLVGSDRFVGNASVGGSDGDVTVRAPSAAGATDDESRLDRAPSSPVAVPAPVIAVPR